MPTPEKEARVAALKESIGAASGVYLSDFSGIPVSMMNELRGNVLDAGGRIEVAKNRLMKLAIADMPQAELSEYLTGPTAITYCMDDPISPARAMTDFAKGLSADTQRWVIKAAFVDGGLFDGERAQALAQLPPVEQIKSGVVGAIAGPVTGLVQTLNAVALDLLQTLQAVADKRTEEAA